MRFLNLASGPSTICAVLLHSLILLQPGQTENVASNVAEPFKSTLGAFRVSQAPVFLPSWLPSKCKGKPLGIGEGPFNQGYEYWFGESNADTYLFGSGGIGKAARTKKHIKLNGGRDACLVFYRNVRCLEWQQGKFCFRIGVPDNQKNDADMIRAANSLLQVSSAVLNTAPRGEDPIAKSQVQAKEAAQASQRTELGAKYAQGIEAASRGDHKKAEKLYRDLISKWKLCDEMPPLSQIQMALAQSLIKMKRVDEAEQISKNFEAKAKSEEEALEKKIDETKKEVESLSKGSADYNFKRAWLGQNRQKLANFFIAEAKYSEAETLFKTAFNDIASTYGRGASDARSISDDYATLLSDVLIPPDFRENYQAVVL